jgi:hypothetical protein
VKKALADGKAAVLLSAADAADDGREKLSRLAGGAVQNRAFSSAALSAAFGKEGVKHAALLKGAAAARFCREARRFEGFCVGPESRAAGR